ncbi:MAG: hypothetical protein IPG85_02210 [Bacteroidetes bacterium]|nr:hypothetical protein [Bacteroidota bacterium]
MKKYRFTLFVFTLICISSSYNTDEYRIALGDRICIVKKTITQANALTLIALHDNENTAIEAFQSWTQQLNINLLELHQSDDRYLKCRYNNRDYCFDPNQVFSEKGIHNTLYEKNSSCPPELVHIIKAFADTLLKMFLNTRYHHYMIAIHNNSSENFSVLSYNNSSNATAVFVSKDEDIDDFFIVTDTSDYEYFKNMNLNVVLQSKNAEEDGSLSVYCQQNQIPYINIEAEHGHLNKQIEMIKIVYDLVSEKKGE